MPSLFSIALFSCYYLKINQRGAYLRGEFISYLVCPTPRNIGCEIPNVFVCVSAIFITLCFSCSVLLFLHHNNTAALVADRYVSLHGQKNQDYPLIAYSKRAIVYVFTL